MTLSHRPTARLSRLALLTTSLIASVAGCGDGAGPDKTLPIAVAAGTLRPFSTALLTLGASAVAEPTVSGSLGEAAVKAARLTDSTVSLLIPEVAAGAHVLTLSSGGRTYRTSLTIEAALPIANPQAELEKVATRVDSMVASQVAALATPFEAPTLSGIDTATIRAQLTLVQQKAASFRASLASLSVAERAQVAAFFASHPELFQQPSAGAGSALVMFNQGACTDGKACYDAIDKVLITIRNSCAAYVAIKLTADAASWLVGLAGKVTLEGVEIVTAGVLLGYVINELATMVRAPIKAALPGSSGNLVLELPVQVATPLHNESLPVFSNGTASAFSVEAQYRSLTASDLVTDAAASAIRASFSRVQDIFATISNSIPFVDIPAPSFPAAVLRRVTQQVPPAQLTLGDMSGTGFGATAAASGTNWMVTFTNPNQGRDHQVTVPIRFTPPGLETQTGTRTVLVRPQVYGVASLEIAAPAQQVGVNQTLTLTTVAKDSSSRILTASELGARVPEWSSLNTGIATVSSSGVVTGKLKGSTTIRATLEKGTASLALTVVDVDSTAIYRDAIVGNWKLEWYYAADGQYAQTDNFHLRANGTGYMTSVHYASGKTVTYAVDDTKTSWTLQKLSTGRYQFRYWQNFWSSVVHQGLLTYPLTPIQGPPGGYYKTVLSKQ